jgi:hypothetical protein
MPACEFPDVINMILQTWQHNPRNKSLFYRYLPFLRYGVQPGIGVAIHKTVLHRAGIFTTDVVRDPAKGWMRSPRRVAGSHCLRCTSSGVWSAGMNYIAVDWGTSNFRAISV